MSITGNISLSRRLHNVANNKENLSKLSNKSFLDTEPKYLTTAHLMFGLDDCITFSAIFSNTYLSLYSF